MFTDTSAQTHEGVPLLLLLPMASRVSPQYALPRVASDV